MKKRTFMRFLKDKAFVLVLAVCFLSAVAMAGVYMFGAEKPEEQNFVDLNEVAEEKVARNSEKEPLQAKIEPEQEIKAAEPKEEPEDLFGMDNVMDATDEYLEEEVFPEMALTEEPEAARKEEEETEESKEPEAAEPAASSSVVKEKELDSTFMESDKITWPVQGNVIMDYNMDNTIFFATLNQYKYNPAIVIQSSENTDVVAAVKGKVTAVENLPETGTTITMSLGNGYEAVYGQLKDCSVKVGDICEKGSVIGKVSAPSKYYTVEGTNLFFEMKKDGTPINPMLYLES